MVRGFAPVPTAALFADFCHKKVVGKLPPALRTPLRDTAVRLERVEGEAGGSGQCGLCFLLTSRDGLPGGMRVRLPCRQALHAGPLQPVPVLPAQRGLHPCAKPLSGCRVHLASGRALVCRAAVYTPSNRCPILPAWARPLAAPPAAGQDGISGQQDCSSRAPPQLPPGIFTADAVHLGSAAGLEGQHIVVVGGGMSAGLLAAGAAERGARVTLVCRRCAAAAAAEAAASSISQRIPGGLGSWRRRPAALRIMPACIVFPCPDPPPLAPPPAGYLSRSHSRRRSAGGEPSS